MHNAIDRFFQRVRSDRDSEDKFVDAFGDGRCKNADNLGLRACNRLAEIQLAATQRFCCHGGGQLHLQ